MNKKFVVDPIEDPTSSFDLINDMQSGTKILFLNNTLKFEQSFKFLQFLCDFEKVMRKKGGKHEIEILFRGDSGDGISRYIEKRGGKMIGQVIEIKEKDIIYEHN